MMISVEAILKFIEGRQGESFSFSGGRQTINGDVLGVHNIPPKWHSHGIKIYLNGLLAYYIPSGRYTVEHGNIIRFDTPIPARIDDELVYEFVPVE